MLAPWKKSYDKTRQFIKKRRHNLTTKVHIVKAWFFQWSCMECESWTKESWAPKNWYFWTVVLEKTLESPLNSKEIKPVNPEGNHFWVFIWGTGAEAETPILWPPGKDTDVGNDWRWEEKGTTENAIVGWHHKCDGHEFE